MVATGKHPRLPLSLVWCSSHSRVATNGDSPLSRRYLASEVGGGGPNHSHLLFSTVRGTWPEIRSVKEHQKDNRRGVCSTQRTTGQTSGVGMTAQLWQTLPAFLACKGSGSVWKPVTPPSCRDPSPLLMTDVGVHFKHKLRGQSLDSSVWLLAKVFIQRKCKSLCAVV